MTIQPDDTFALFAILALSAAFGMIGERKNWFRGVSGVIVTISTTAILVTLGWIPSAADSELSVPIYDFVFTYLIPISIPLLLFNVQIGRIVRASGKLLGIFLVGALGIALGAVVAAWLIDLGPEEYKVAGAFVGTYTGGSVNFMAVSSAFDFLESPLFPATIAVDVGFTNVYLLLLFLLPAVGFIGRQFPPDDAGDKAVDDPMADPAPVPAGTLMEQLAICFSIAGVLCALGTWWGQLLADWLNTDINLDVLLITLIIVVAANVFPNYLRPLADVAFETGMFLLFIFLAVIGAASNVYAILNAAPGLLLFVIILLSVHLIVSLVLGRLFRLPIRTIMIASAANVGGVSIAAPMAATFGLKKLVSPAVLMGILGYVIGTFLGVGVGFLLR